MAGVTIFGHQFSPAELGGVGVGAAVLTYAVWKQHKTSAAAAAATTATAATAIDPVTGLPYSEDSEIDPLTGQSYLAEAQEYGSVTAAEDSTADESAIDYSQADTSDYGPAGETSTTSTGVVAQTYASNAAWAQAVEAGLTDVGYTSTDIAAALGLYLASLPLGTAPDGTSYATIVEAAIAEYNPPPVGTYQIIMAPATGSTGSGGGGGATPPVVVAKPAAAPGGLETSQSGATATASWKPVAGATSYNFGISPAPKGGTAGSHNIGERTSYNVAGMVKGTTYKVTVSAENSGGTGPAATHSFKAT